MPLFALGFKPIHPALAALRPFVFGLLVSAALAQLSCSTGDISCEPGADPANLEDACPYGPPGGPRRVAGECPPVDFGLAADEPCTTTWADVYAIFDDPTRGRCTNLACHGSSDGAARAYGVFLPEQEPDLGYASLSNYLDFSGNPYLGEDDPRAWILCNLQGLPGGGKAMPKPDGLQSISPPPEGEGAPLQTLDIDTVRRWVVCGMRQDGGGAFGGGGFGGGEVGGGPIAEGGAGGVGGVGGAL